MYGPRGRIGLIVPSSNTVCEPEMAALCPEGVRTYSTRILFEPTLESLRAMKNHVQRACRELSSEGICKIIAFCCTIGSMIEGPDYDQSLIRHIEDNTGVSALTTTTAVKAALGALGVKRLAIATPYTREIDQLEKTLFERMGYEVTNIKGYHNHIPPGEFTNEMIGCLSPEASFNLAMEITDSRDEAVFISCTNFRAIENIEKLEKELGKPVISSNQAAMWYALRKLGLRDRVHGFGQLLTSPLP